MTKALLLIPILCALQNAGNAAQKKAGIIADRVALAGTQTPLPNIHIRVLKTS